MRRVGTRLALTMAVLGLGLAGAGARAGEAAGHDHAKADKPSPQLEALKALAGEWEGTARSAGEKTIPTKATFKVVSGGSVVMLVTAPGTPHEMVTMFHQDDGALIATHYCAANNQPRMKAAGGDARTLNFEFMDGTNLGAHPGRMQALVVAMPEAGRHTQTWTYRDGDQTSTMVMELARAK